MADLFSMLNRAVRALDAQRYGMDVAGQNIGNVNTPGYARRTAQLAESLPTDPFGPGGGVDVVAVTSSRAPLIQARLNFEEPSAAREDTIAQSLEVIESAIGTPGASLDDALARFYNTYAALAQNPTSGTARQQVIAEGTNLTRGFADVASRFQTAQSEADLGIRAAVSQVNALAAQLANINKQIAGTDASNVQGLVDQQSVVVSEIGKLVDVHVISRDNGAIDVTVGNGRGLVIADQAFDLSFTTSSISGYAQIISDGAAVPTDVTGEITGGSIGGLIKVRDTLVPTYMNQLDTLAYKIATDVNTQTTSGYDLQGNPGVAFFTPPAGAAGYAQSIAVNPAVAADNRLVVASATNAPGNNDVARNIGNLQTTPMSGTNSTPIQGWGTLVYSVANDSRTAQESHDAHEQVAQQLRNIRDSISGVSLDEEAASLLRFQRAYEANARFFNVANDLLDVLMSLAR